MKNFGNSNSPLDFKTGEELRVQTGKTVQAQPIDLADPINTRK